MKSKISERLSQAVAASAPWNSKYAWLESLSADISIDSWKSALSGRQRPTAEMLECFCRHEPDLAFFVVTGTLPNSNQIHTNPRRKQLSKMKLEIREILSKEPIDWSDDEKDFLIVSCEDNRTQNVNSDVIYLAIEVSQSGKLLKDFFKEEEMKLTFELNNEMRNTQWDENGSFPAGTRKNAMVEAQNRFKSNASELKKYRDQKS